MAADLLIVFARYPEPYLCKTRLIPALGPEGAADLCGRLLRHTISWVQEFSEREGAEVHIRFVGGNAAAMVAYGCGPFLLLPQGEGELGTRIERAVNDGFAQRSQHVVVVGTDCPGMTTELAVRAFHLLRDSDVVLGPALDGGYYLIGLKRPEPALFADIDWGTKRVFKQTRQIALGRCLTVAELPPLADIDRPEDLDLLSELPLRSSSTV